MAKERDLIRVAKKLKEILGTDLSIKPRGDFIEITYDGKTSRLRSQKQTTRHQNQVRDR